MDAASAVSEPDALDDLWAADSPGPKGGGKSHFVHLRSVPTAYPAGSYAGPRDSRGRCQAIQAESRQIFRSS